MNTQAEREELREERARMRDAIDALPLEYQRRLMDTAHRMMAVFARMTGISAPVRSLPPNVIPLRRK